MQRLSRVKLREQIHLHRHSFQQYAVIEPRLSRCTRIKVLPYGITGVSVSDDEQCSASILVIIFSNSIYEQTAIVGLDPQRNPNNYHQNIRYIRIGNNYSTSIMEVSDSWLFQDAEHALICLGKLSLLLVVGMIR